MEWFRSKRRENFGIYCFLIAARSILPGERYIIDLFPTFLFSQAFLLSFRFSKSFSTVEEQRGILTATNASYKKEITERKRAEEEKIKLTIQL